MLALLKENYDKLDNILKSRDISLLTKVCLVKVMVFSVVMFGCETWTIEKPCQGVWALSRVMGSQPRI